MKHTLLTLLILGFSTGCGGDPEPCDTLCEDAGFQGIDETNEGCFCSSPSGLGGSLTQEACDTYCKEYGSSTGTLATENSTDDSCLCTEGS